MNRAKQAEQVFAVTTDTMKKLLLSGLVVLSFTAYAVHERLTGSDNSTSSQSNSANNQSSTLQLSSAPGKSVSLYRDGQYTGDVADAYWGNVEVQTVIQNGKIATVQFLDYPHDRGTSRMINSQAMPYLISEAVQYQTARVNVISGATLTSQAFIQSLQSALDKART